jgi:RNA polymerase sigma factor (sigma-70 family)
MTMSEDWLARQFEFHRPRLRAAAYRMLGARCDADDAVQEAWLRLSRSQADGIDDLGAWLTTVVGRVCLNMLRSRRVRREVSPVDDALEPAAADDPEGDAAHADSVGLALLVVLEALTPDERVAFVLHDMFDLPFEEIAPIIGRTPVAARQLASRARRRVQGRTTANTDIARQRAVAEAFMTAARGGDMQALMAVLHPDIVLRADSAAMARGAPRILSGAAAVAHAVLAGAKRGGPTRIVLINGAAGMIIEPGGRLQVALAFTIDGDKISEIEAIAEPAHLARLDIAVLDS